MDFTSLFSSDPVIAQFFCAAFLSILFLQSGADKVLDRKGNLDWLIGHFANSPLKGTVPFLLSVITLFELVAGVTSGIGAAMLLLGQGAIIAWYGAILSAASITMLFFGQRIAKDYAGAATLVPYFLLSIVAILLLN